MGCRVTHVLVDGEPVAMIVCGRKARGKQCVVCKTQYDIRLCDYPLRGAKQGQTCGRPVCGAHAMHQPPDVDYCPSHARVLAVSEQQQPFGAQ